MLEMVVVDYLIGKEHVQKKKPSVRTLWKMLEEHRNII